MQVEALLAQLTAAQAKAEDPQAVFGLLEPARLLVANSASLQKEIQGGMKKFAKLTKYKDKLEELTLKMCKNEDKLLDDLALLQHQEINKYANQFCIEDEEVFSVLRKEVEARIEQSLRRGSCEL